MFNSIRLSASATEGKEIAGIIIQKRLGSFDMRYNHRNNKGNWL
jgi:hypothetical protein